VNILRSRGTRGFRYDSEREARLPRHRGTDPQGTADIELGLQILEALADYLLPAVEALQKHRDYLKQHPPKRLERQEPLDK